MATTLHRAGWVMVHPQCWIEDGVVEISDGHVRGVEAYDGRRPVMDHGAGVIMPALINAHAHVSLSALAGRIRTDQGFVSWVKGLIEAKTQIPEETASAEAERAVQAARRSGTGFLAEVGPFCPGAGALAAAAMDGICFEEVLGSYPVPALPCDTDGLTFSYAGHALHTTPPEVLQKLKKMTEERHKPFSLHLAESEAEEQFLATGAGEWALLLTSRGIDFSRWGPWGDSPVKKAERIGLLGPRTLTVHLLCAPLSDMAVLAETRTSLCVCPRSNLALHDRLPDIEAMMGAGLAPALGTDSLASVPSLSLFDEMAFVAGHYPSLGPEAILTMATTNGAKALCRQDLGALAPDVKAKPMYVDLTARSAKEAASSLVTNQFNHLEWL